MFKTEPIKKTQTELIQIKIAKNGIWFGCIQIIFLLNRMVWFEPNQTKP